MGTEASDPHHEPNKLLDQVHQVLKPLDFSSQIFTSLNDTYQTLTETSPNLSCWLCLPLRPRPLLAQPIPRKWIEAQNLTRNVTEVTLSMGPLTTEILYLPANASCVLANDTSLTTVACDNLRQEPLSPNPPICRKPGIFFLCNQTTLLLFSTQLDSALHPCLPYSLSDHSDTTGNGRPDPANPLPPEGISCSSSAPWRRFIQGLGTGGGRIGISHALLL